MKKKIAAIIGVILLAVCILHLPQGHTSAGLSDDVKLAELLVFPGDLNQGFSPDVQDYTVYVPANAEEFLVSAVPMSGGSSVNVSKPAVLAYGENLALVQISSASGNFGEYRIHVFRGDYGNQNEEQNAQTVDAQTDNTEENLEAKEQEELEKQNAETKDSSKQDSEQDVEKQKSNNGSQEEKSHPAENQTNQGSTDPNGGSQKETEQTPAAEAPAAEAETPAASQEQDSTAEETDASAETDETDQTEEVVEQVEPLQEGNVAETMEMTE